MTERPFVTVVVPCRNERRYIGACLASILASDYPRDRLEILVVDGQSDDGTPAIVAEVAAREPVVRLLPNPERIVPTGLNRALREARGDVVIRMDAHSSYPADYVSALVGWLERTGADNVGGAWVTLPANDGAIARGIALALAHRLGIGGAAYRLGTDEPREVDTVPFGCYRRAVFERIGGFDEELVRNQDDEFNSRLRRAGGRIVLVPGVVSYYYARPTWRQLARMFYQYGLFKPLVIRKVGAVMTARQLAPGALVSALVAGLVLAPWVPAARWAVAGLVGLYAVLALGAVAGLVRRHGPAAAAACAASFPVLHLSYGLGFLLGLPRAAGARSHPRRVVSDLPLSR